MESFAEILAVRCSIVVLMPIPIASNISKLTVPSINKRLEPHQAPVIYNAVKAPEDVILW